MNKIDVKLLILDMDGTSYHKMGPIIKQNIEPLKKVIQKGIKVVFVTGRPVLAKLNSLKDHGLLVEHQLIAGYNAACIYDLSQNQILLSNVIESEQAKKVFDLVTSDEYKNSDIKIWGYVDDLKTVITNKWTNNPNDYHFETAFFDGQILEYKDVKDNFDFKFFKLLGFDANKEFYDILINKLEFNVATNDQKLAEINKKHVNKKLAVEWFSNYFNIDLKNIAAIGDGMNDWEMINHVGYKVAIKNSVDEIKKIANIYIDKTAEQGAVEEFIKHYILGE
ncbi:HAD family hydrolase [Mycoplasma feriruminatoris]|uniref:HAD family hydrolase n=1 Tax=Mycoplasma feriruminatoris TaxID=1179777 RepID=A0AAQ3HZR7_9MOLU|nr:HAD-IIB family hydrolase [Mycoplasma feriruminatoris]UKS53828.1 HAD hydrolase, IIB family protein [Mycoplasma feriruminatoris]WFQ90746.1 HAD family hydrolase [Mycoplasma feriruminatoris]WFQ93263.1 HAD family hydrolase [Mycoplasma feriruminatoris]WFQ94920.1 HAD family hydrolase [Mycoplasma feriruminatoris]VZK65015.1 5-amino-6-(5-phospho-D-ribitylamino)uracil phosphatase YwtE [Mycoplasma feriruminatoris]